MNTAAFEVDGTFHAAYTYKELTLVTTCETGSEAFTLRGRVTYTVNATPAHNTRQKLAVIEHRGLWLVCRHLTGERYARITSHRTQETAVKNANRRARSYVRAYRKPRDTTQTPAKRIYISGPMTGHPELNFPAFHTAAAHYRAQGHHVENPAELNAPDGTTYADLLLADLHALSTCGHVVLLAGWQKSKGARAEKALAEALGLTITEHETERPQLCQP